MEIAERLERGESWSEVAGVAAEVHDLVLTVARAALESDRAGEAEQALEGLVAIQPRDARAWALLSRAHRATGKWLAARFAAAVACHLAPGSPDARLARAEALLGEAGDRAEALSELRALRATDGAIGARAEALLAGLGEVALRQNAPDR